jgi:hypothetical protein
VRPRRPALAASRLLSSGLPLAVQGGSARVSVLALFKYCNGRPGPRPPPRPPGPAADRDSVTHRDWQASLFLLSSATDSMMMISMMMISRGQRIPAAAGRAAAAAAGRGRPGRQLEARAGCSVVSGLPLRLAA